MAFQPSKTSAKQTGFNTAATLVAAFTTAGFYEDVEEAKGAFFEIADDVFADLDALVDEDSAAAVPVRAATPREQGISAYRRQPATQVATSDDPGDFQLTWGRHNGETLGQIAASEPGYIDWLVRDTNPNRRSAQEAARRFQESRRAGV